MRVDSAKLQALLKQRYGTPRVLLQHLLGQDAGLVAPGGGNTDEATAMRVELENLLGELNLDEKQIGRILEVLDKHASFDLIDDDDPNAEKARKLAGDDIEKFRDLLASAGMTESDIAGAVAIAEKARGLPQNALRGGYGAQLGTDSKSTFADRHPECARISGADLEAPRRRKLAQDKASTAAASTLASFYDRHPEAARVL